MPGYKTLGNYWCNSCSGSTREKFFMSYALNGAIIDPENGVRAGIPTVYPLKNSPVSEPSPLNTRWMYEIPEPRCGAGIL